MDAMERIVEAVLSGRPKDLAGLLKSAPELARLRFDRERLVEEIPHQLYVGDTPLHLAAAAVRVAAAKALIAVGGEIDAANRRGARPLHYACDPRPSGEARWRPEEQAELIMLLAAHGADVDAEDKSGVRPLHRAVRARSPGAVGALIAAGCKVRAKAGKAGSTPLHLAVAPSGASGTAGSIEQQAEIVVLLVRAGARLRDADGQGQAATDRIRSAVLRKALSERGLLD
jgi:hypothetical protein